MLKLIHGADFHLDSPFSGLSPRKAALRRGEQRQLLADLAALVREREADLVLLSGDLFDSHRIYRETAKALSAALGEMPCPVFIAPGNHDCFAPDSPYETLDWPDNVHIFTSDRPEAVTLEALNCTVWGRAFLSPHDSRDPLAGFRAPEDGRVHLMALHGDTAGGEDYCPIAPESVAGSGLTYLALGHIHRCSGLQRSGGTFWAYPGCPQGRGFDETGDKGVLYVELDGAAVTADLVPLCRRRYERVTVDVTGRPPLEAILSTIPRETVEDIYRIELTGACEAPDLAGLEGALAPRFFGLSLRDHTVLPTDLWARRREDGLTGLFLELMHRKCQAEPDNEIYQQAARFGLAALEHGEDPYL